MTDNAVNKNGKGVVAFIVAACMVTLFANLQRPDWKPVNDALRSPDAEIGASQTPRLETARERAAKRAAKRAAGPPTVYTAAEAAALGFDPCDGSGARVVRYDNFAGSGWYLLNDRGTKAYLSSVGDADVRGMVRAANDTHRLTGLDRFYLADFGGCGRGF